MDSGNPEYDEMVSRITEAINVQYERRKFWEMCAASAVSDPNLTELQAARCADAMLKEWDRRWNKENGNV